MKQVIGISDKNQGLACLGLWVLIVAGSVWRWGSWGILAGVWLGSWIAGSVLAILDFLSYRQFYLGKKEADYGIMAEQLG